MLRRTFTGTGIAAVAAVAALALSGCSSGGDNEGKKTPTASTSASGQPTDASGTPTTPSTSGTQSSSPGATGDPTQGVEGVWIAAQGSAKVQLVLGKGEAGLTSTHLCGGTYTDRDGVGLTLTCMDGDKERTSGRGVLGADGKTLTVQWTGGVTDTFSRTGLPSS